MAEGMSAAVGRPAGHLGVRVNAAEDKPEGRDQPSGLTPSSCFIKSRNRSGTGCLATSS